MAFGGGSLGGVVEGFFPVLPSSEVPEHRESPGYFPVHDLE